MGSCVSHVQPRSEYLTPQVPIENLNVKAVKRRIKSGMLAPFYVGVEADTDTTLDKDVSSQQFCGSVLRAFTPQLNRCSRP
jgi:hypothetical protein